MNEWIRIEDRLPEEKKDVLVMFGNGDMAVASMGIAKDDDGVYTYWSATTDEGWITDCTYKPTHWMSLPEPPKEVDDDA